MRNAECGMVEEDSTLLFSHSPSHLCSHSSIHPNFLTPHSALRTPHFLLSSGQFHNEARAAGAVVFDPDAALVVADDLMDYREAETCAAAAG